jgi:carbamoyl-phosphate synthase large subunit
MGFALAATSGTAAHLRDHGVEVAVDVAKLGEPDGRDAVELIESGQVDLVINSPRGRGPRSDGAHIRAAAGAQKVPLLTTAAAGAAAAAGMADRARHALQVRPLQEYLRGVGAHELEPRADQPTLPDLR